MADKEKRYRYFLYSAEQEALRKNLESKMSKEFIIGEVMVNGVWKPYTQISIQSDNVAYADAKVVAKGYLEDMEYTECSTRWK